MIGQEEESSKTDVWYLPSSRDETAIIVIRISYKLSRIVHLVNQLRLFNYTE